MTKSILLFLYMLIFLSSCKHDYTCTCSYGSGSSGNFYRSEEVAIYTNVTKSAAKKECKSEEYKHWTKYAPYGVTPKDSLIVCTIK